jgi:hypothetical protein
LPDGNGAACETRALGGSGVVVVARGRVVGGVVLAGAGGRAGAAIVGGAVVGGATVVVVVGSAVVLVVGRGWWADARAGEGPSFLIASTPLATPIDAHTARARTSIRNNGRFGTPDPSVCYR